MKKILVSLSFIGAVAAVVVGATTAFFSDTETSTGNVISAGSLDLKVNGFNTPVGAVVNLTDLKPSQTWWSGPITLEVHNNPGKLYKHIVHEPNSTDPNRIISCETASTTEPECEAEGGTWIGGQCTGTGHIQQNFLPHVTWFDLEMWVGPDTAPSTGSTANRMCDGQITTNCWNVLIPDGKKTVAEIASKWIYLGTYGEPGQTNRVTIRQSFHLDGELANNAYQSDRCTFNEEFMVLQTNAPHPASFFDVFTELD